MSDRAWVQAAIDVESMDVAKSIAFMALDNGAEWLEVGTPLLYKYGYSAIGEIRKAVGNNAILVADYKCPYAGLIADQAAQQGADYIMLSAAYNDELIIHGIDVCKKAGIKPIFDLHINPRDVQKRTIQLADLGVEYLFTHHYAKYADDSGQIETYDTLKQIKDSNTSMKIGITSDDWHEAQDAVQKGADWMIFGYVLRTPNQESCKKWIDMLHSVR